MQKALCVHCEAHRQKLKKSKIYISKTVEDIPKIPTGGPKLFSTKIINQKMHTVKKNENSITAKFQKVIQVSQKFQRIWTPGALRKSEKMLDSSQFTQFPKVLPSAGCMQAPADGDGPVC